MSWTWTHIQTENWNYLPLVGFCDPILDPTGLLSLYLREMH